MMLYIRELTWDPQLTCYSKIQASDFFYHSKDIISEVYMQRSGRDVSEVCVLE